MRGRSSIRWSTLLQTRPKQKQRTVKQVIMYATLFEKTGFIIILVHAGVNVKGPTA